MKRRHRQGAELVDELSNHLDASLRVVEEDQDPAHCVGRERRAILDWAKKARIATCGVLDLSGIPFWR
jgi:hypothetical protein